MDHFIVLKSEQTARLVLRDTALYIYLGAIIAIYAAEGQAGSNADLVQIIRLCSVGLVAIMFSIYLSNDYYVSKIGKFISENAGDDFRRWETYHRVGLRYRLQKYLRTIVVVFLFGGWALFQGLQAYSTPGTIGRWVVVACGIVVAIQLLFFLSMELGGQSATKQHSSATGGEL